MKTSRPQASKFIPVRHYDCSETAITHTRVTQKLQLTFLSIGKWVEVDADRTPGWNSEGGIAVFINVNDGLADVK